MDTMAMNDTIEVVKSLNPYFREWGILTFLSVVFGGLIGVVLWLYRRDYKIIAANVGKIRSDLLTLLQSSFLDEARAMFARVSEYLPVALSQEGIPVPRRSRMDNFTEAAREFAADENGDDSRRKRYRLILTELLTGIITDEADKLFGEAKQAMEGQIPYTDSLTGISFNFSLDTENRLAVIADSLSITKKKDHRYKKSLRWTWRFLWPLIVSVAIVGASIFLDYELAYYAANISLAIGFFSFLVGSYWLMGFIQSENWLRENAQGKTHPSQWLQEESSQD